MDTTKKYIEMCEKAEEIQKEWKPKRGDFYTVVVHGKATDITDVYIDGFPLLPQRFISLSELYIWLPRQDQLQEMLDKWTLLAKVRGLFDFCEPEFTCPEEPTCKECVKLGLYARKNFISMEQLWLAFVMKEKYNKMWNGKDWKNA